MQRDSLGSSHCESLRVFRPAQIQNVVPAELVSDLDCPTRRKTHSTSSENCCPDVNSDSFESQIDSSQSSPFFETATHQRQLHSPNGGTRAHQSQSQEPSCKPHARSPSSPSAPTPPPSKHKPNPASLPSRTSKSPPHQSRAPKRPQQDSPRAGESVLGRLGPHEDSQAPVREIQSIRERCSGGRRCTSM